MKKNPRVSLGLPVYNGEVFLESTLRSILGQTFSDFELIISDNASTDRTEEICRAFEITDSRIRYVRNETNLGAAPNYNQVFELAVGDYFKWIAYDDPLEPGYLSSCVQVLDKHPDVVLCFTRAKIINEDAEIIGEDLYPVDVFKQQPDVRFRNVALGLDAVPRVPIAVFGLMRSDAVGRTGLIGSYPSSDVVFLAELTLYGGCFEIDEALLHWRHHPKQSVRGELASDRNRSLWFNTALEGRILLPKWSYLLGYMRAVRNAPLSVSHKLLCTLTLLRWSLRLRNAKPMAKDVLLAARTVLLRTIWRLFRHDLIAGAEKERA